MKVFKPEDFKRVIQRFEEKAKAGWAKDSLEDMLCDFVNDALRINDLMPTNQEDCNDSKGAYP